MNDVDWYALLSWGLSLFTSLGFSWNISLTGTLIGIYGGLALQNISARVFNASLSPFPSLVGGFSGSVFCSK